MLQRGLNRSNALAGLSFWSQMLLNDTRTRSEMSVSLVRSDRKIMGVAADVGPAGRCSSPVQVGVGGSSAHAADAGR